MKKYNLVNNVTGWLVFLISLVVYTLTLEPTASFWDCGEFLSAADKLQVVHPPGAPMFLLIGKVFSLLSFGDSSKVAFWMNMLSATTSAFTCLFMFWTITHLAKKILLPKGGEMNAGQLISIIGSGLVGALTVTFLDTFWFSAVEAEVYASSCFFTAITFWAILKWENRADEPYGDKWLILICYFIGLAIGVHLLNLLVIPAIVFVYYFRKYEVTPGNFFGALVAAFSGIILVQFIVIPGYPWFAAKTDLFLVNRLGLPFNSGFVLLIALITAAVYFGLNWAKKNGKTLAHTLILGVAFISIGYSSYTMIIVRSIAEVPLDHQDVEDPMALLSYLNREQYGDRPLFRGQNFTAQPTRVVEGAMQYRRGKDKYEQTTNKFDYEYDPSDMTYFPRMWSNREDHVQAYKQWENLADGQKPKFKHNMHFLFSYQLGFMYWRYFFWNFVGRQNDLQGHGELTHGKVLSGISALDKLWLGPQDNIPEDLTDNKGRNTYFFLPLILGLLGFIFHLGRQQKDFFVIMLLFLFTGIFIIFYLNFPPLQPRERDYAYVGSYQYFCVWVGLGVLAIIDWLSKKVNRTTAAVGATAVSLLGAPVLMASQNWDDHDRSGRTTCLDFARDYLESCDSNAVLFTNGDNDTYPLWYAQNVEGLRTDVRVINLSLLNTDWYADVMKRATYKSGPIYLQLNSEQYVQGKRDYLPILSNIGAPALGVAETTFVDLKKVMDFVAREDGSNMAAWSGGGKVDYYWPTSKLSIAVNKANCIKNRVIEPKDEGMMQDQLRFEIGKRALYKNDMIVLDYIANNNWNRPVYFTITTGSEAYINMQNYFQLDGLCYRLVPIYTPSDEEHGREIGHINTDKLYNTVMNKWKFGGMDQEGIYIDETTMRQTRNLRNVFCRLANALAEEGKNDKAVEVLDRCMQVMPVKNVPLDFGTMRIAQSYLIAGAKEKGKALLNQMIAQAQKNLQYYERFTGKDANMISSERDMDMYMFNTCTQIMKQYENFNPVKPSQEELDQVKKAQEAAAKKKG